jgi:hypothetical protein
MTQFKLPTLSPKSPKSSFLIIIFFFAIVIGLVYFNEYNNRVNFAKNGLTEKDWMTCATEINSVNFEDCWNYLHGEGASKKDMNALDTGIFGSPIYGMPEVKKSNPLQDFINFVTGAFS